MALLLLLHLSHLLLLLLLSVVAVADSPPPSVAAAAAASPHMSTTVILDNTIHVLVSPASGPLADPRDAAVAFLSGVAGGGTPEQVAAIVALLKDSHAAFARTSSEEAPAAEACPPLHRLAPSVTPLTVAGAGSGGVYAAAELSTTFPLSVLEQHAATELRARHLLRRCVSGRFALHHGDPLLFPTLPGFRIFVHPPTECPHVSHNIMASGLWEAQRTRRMHLYMSAAPPASAAGGGGAGGAGLERLEPVFLDVGANIGWYSLLVAAMTNHSVVAFEPMPYNAELFEASIEANVGASERIHVVRAAAVDPADMAEGDMVSGADMNGADAGSKKPPRWCIAPTSTASARAESTVVKGVGVEEGGEGRRVDVQWVTQDAPSDHRPTQMGNGQLVRCADILGDANADAETGTGTETGTGMGDRRADRHLNADQQIETHDRAPRRVAQREEDQDSAVVTTIDREMARLYPTASATSAAASAASAASTARGDANNDASNDARSSASNNAYGAYVHVGKFDVEGYELSALRGAEKTFLRSPPCVLMVEWTPEMSRSLHDGDPFALFRYMDRTYPGVYV